MGFELFFDLRADWRTVAGSRAATHAMQRWANDPVLGTARSPDELLARTAAGADCADAGSDLRALVFAAGRSAVRRASGQCTSGTARQE